MRRFLHGLLFVGVVALTARAEDPPAKPTSPAPGKFAALKKEYEEAETKFQDDMQEKRKEAQKAFREAKTDEERKEILKKYQTKNTDGPNPKFSPRFLELAEQNPRDPAALEALALAMRTSGGPTGPAG